MRAIHFLPILAAIWCAGGAEAAIIPDCAGDVEISGAHVMRVERNGALILTDGRAVMLEGLRLPQGDADGAPRFLADQAISALVDMTSGGMVFTATPPKEDRYDRVRAQAFGKTWLQQTLLEQGLARVAISPDRNDCAPDLYEAEARARQRRAGLWAIAAYQVRAPENLQGTKGSFQIVEGRVANVGGGSGRTFIDFSADWNHGFSVTVAPGDRAAFRDFDFESLRGRHVRVRGIIQDYRGRPQIALSNPAQIEMLDK